MKELIQDSISKIRFPNKHKQFPQSIMSPFIDIRLSSPQLNVTSREVDFLSGVQRILISRTIEPAKTVSWQHSPPWSYNSERWSWLALLAF